STVNQAFCLLNLLNAVSNASAEGPTCLPRHFGRLGSRPPIHPDRGHRRSRAAPRYPSEANRQWRFRRGDGRIPWTSEAEDSMQRNMDLVRMILMRLESSPAGWAPRDLGIKSFPPEQIGYHSYIMMQEGLIEGANSTTSDSAGPG